MNYYQGNGVNRFSSPFTRTKNLDSELFRKHQIAKNANIHHTKSWPKLHPNISPTPFTTRRQAEKVFKGQEFLRRQMVRYKLQELSAVSIGSWVLSVPAGRYYIQGILHLSWWEAICTDNYSEDNRYDNGDCKHTKTSCECYPRWVQDGELYKHAYKRTGPIPSL